MWEQVGHGEIHALRSQHRLFRPSDIDWSLALHELVMDSHRLTGSGISSFCNILGALVLLGTGLSGGQTGACKVPPTRGPSRGTGRHVCHHSLKRLHGGTIKQKNNRLSFVVFSLFSFTTTRHSVPISRTQGLRSAFLSPTRPLTSVGRDRPPVSATKKNSYVGLGSHTLLI